MTEIAARVQKLLAEHLGADLDRVTPEARFIEDLGADSLDQVEIVMALEEEFGVEIPDEQMETIATAADAARVVTAILAPEPAK